MGFMRRVNALMIEKKFVDIIRMFWDFFRCSGGSLRFYIFRLFDLFKFV